jgi:hypothetical protein
MLSTLAGLGLIQEEAAAVMGCSAVTIRKKYHDVWANGRTTCHASLRRKMFEVAMKGHVGMLCFLAKNYLGMRDDPEAPRGTDQVAPTSIVYIQAVNRALGYTGELVPLGSGQMLEAHVSSDILPE